MPALLGSKEVGNFTTHAGPGSGTYLVARRRRQGTLLRYAGLVAAAAPPTTGARLRRALPPLLYLLGLAALLVAVARPAAVNPVRIPSAATEKCSRHEERLG